VGETRRKIFTAEKYLVTKIFALLVNWTKFVNPELSGCFDFCREWISVRSRYTWASALCSWCVSHTYVWDACFGTSTHCDSRSHRMSEVLAMHCTSSSETPAVMRHYLPSIPLRPRRHQLYWDITCHPFHSVLGDTSCTEITCHPFHSVLGDTSCTETLPAIHVTPFQRHQLYWDNQKFNISIICSRIITLENFQRHKPPNSDHAHNKHSWTIIRNFNQEQFITHWRWILCDPKHVGVF